MMTLKEKILEICEKYAKNFDAKLWLLGTNIYGSISLLVRNIKKNFTPNELNLLTTLKIEKCGPQIIKYAKQKQLQARYKIVLNDKNVTPINNYECAACGTIRQYFQELIAINFVNGSQKHFDIKNNSFNILPPLKSCIFEENIEENITKQFIKLITYSGYSEHSQKFEKNLAYSLFLSLLYMYDETKQIISEINIEYLKPITSRSILNHISSSLEIIKKLANYRNQFREICQKIKKYIGAFSNFESKILDKMISNNDEKIVHSNSNIQQFIQNGISKINNERNKLKQNICQDRNYSEDGNALYSDFDNYNGRSIKNYYPCHIFQIKQIKNAFQDEILDLHEQNVENKIEYEKILVKYQNFAKLSSNGLLMSSDVHAWYDKNAFGFDFSNGKIWIKIDYEKEVAEAWGLDINHVKKIKIKNNILNDDMKSFLKLRVNG